MKREIQSVCRDSTFDPVDAACRAIRTAEAILIGASNGLSIAEGYHIFADNDLFRRQFGDFRERYGIRCVLEGCFFRYPSEQVRQAFLQRLVQYWVTDYRSTQVMQDLRAIVGPKEYFVLTTNADTHLERSGFDASRVFELEGTFQQLLDGQPVEDKSPRFREFLTRNHRKPLIVIELGVGRNNRLIRQPLLRLASDEPRATYLALNLAAELSIPETVAPKAIGLAGDLGATLHDLKTRLQNRV